MDVSSNSTTADAATAANTGPEYNTSLVKKAKLQSTLAALLNDPILSDVTKNPTLSDVDTLINLELGSAMRICVLKMDGTSVVVAVMNSASVKDLKLAIKKKVNDMEETRMGHRQISWKHVWANFCLSYHNVKLLDDNSALQAYGIRNNSQMTLLLKVINSQFDGYTEGVLRLWKSWCILFPMLFQGLLNGILEGKNTVSFTV